MWCKTLKNFYTLSASFAGLNKKACKAPGKINYWQHYFGDKVLRVNIYGCHKQIVTMENFSAQWFTAYYVALGLLLVSFGLYLLFKTAPIKEFLLSAAEEKKPPVICKSVLKYLFLFTIPGLILSFTPFSWIELVFSLWCLVIIFTAGQLLLLWPQTAKAIQQNEDLLPRKIRFAAANMISIGIILFLLCYLLFERAGTY